MKKRILIANRGEIAVRVIKSAQKMGFETVVIYADDDLDLLYVSKADIQVSLGSGELKDTYLNQEKIIQIAKDYNVWGIHPGYGFLSENAEFCEAVESSNIKFIGANPEAMRIMGDKKASKKHIEKLSVPLIPGYHGDGQVPEELKKEAIKIGFPVLIKASAGGGGKGMRIVHSESDFLEALSSAKSEALKSFSNDQVLIEKFITKPRHIEVQLMSDTHGNHLHFFERECSIQRRYQKIIEEAPSVAIDEKLRGEMCAAAVKIAQGVSYRGAGTLEFILDEKNCFYFLEMNTRLQVEHPVTEMITGFDLVELQIRVANDEKFEFKQEDITKQGHAIECRIYSENPDNDFLPTTGTISVIGENDQDNTRIETGYREGNSVNVNYDPMIAKVVVRAATRSQALSDMKFALNRHPFLGVKTNRNYLLRILNEEDYIQGVVDTNYVVNHQLQKEGLSAEEQALAIGAYLLGDQQGQTFSKDFEEMTNPWSDLAGFRN